MRWARLALVLSLAACSPEIPDAVYVCAADADCPPQMTCIGGLCRRGALIDAGPCTPMGCTELRAECGPIDDGCGTEIDCGTCVAPETCGEGGIANICDCQPVGCEPEQCGDVPNGCGAMIYCGGCDAGLDCVENACTCSAATCDGRCGDIPDGCGAVLSCGGCVSPATCGGGGPNLCGTGTCTPIGCGPSSCGDISDGCGNVVSCGTCDAPATCGGGDPGVENVCGCTPQTCSELGPATCGPLIDVCGETVICPDCTPPSTCGGGGVANQCGCTPPSCAPMQCGFVPNPCGGASIACGPCSDGSPCIGGVCGGGCGSDSAEDNDTYETAYLVGPIPPVPITYGMWNIEEGTTDADYYEWTFGASGSLARNVAVSLSGFGTTSYSVAAFVECGASRPSFTCLVGSEVTDPAGCESTDSSEEAVRVTISVGCAISRFVVAVRPKEASSTCLPYDLTVEATTPAVEL